jgi:hypothetical protein
MALINCPECKKEISDKAGKCPNCGYPILQKVYNYKPPNKNELNLVLAGVIIVIILLLVAFISVFTGAVKSSPQNVTEYSFNDSMQMKRATHKKFCDHMDSLKGNDVKRVFYNADDIIKKLEKQNVMFGTPTRVFSHNSSETKDHVKDLHKYRLEAKNGRIKIMIEYDSETHDLLDSYFELYEGNKLSFESYTEMKKFILAMAEMFDQRAMSYYDKKLDIAFFQNQDSSIEGDFDLPDKNIAFTITKDCHREFDNAISLTASWQINHPNHYYDPL